MFFILLGVLPGFFKMIISNVKGANFPIGETIKVCK